MVGEEIAQRFRSGLEDVMEADSHATDGAYAVSSIYFDSRDLADYHEKLDGVDPRHKIRLRWYGRVPRHDDQVAFLEAKHRFDRRVAKSRVKLPGSVVAEALDQPILSPAIAGDGSDEAVVLSRLVARRPIEPVAVVSYLRRPFVSRLDPTLRVTIDHRLRARRPLGLLDDEGHEGAPFLPSDLVVLEIKFHWSMPLWLLELTRSLGMIERRYSKYASAAELLHPERTHRQVRRADART